MKKWKGKANKCPACGSMVVFSLRTVSCDKCGNIWKYDGGN